MYENIDNLNNVPKNEKIQSVFELSHDMEQFGGVQKFVLLKVDDKYVIGSLPSFSHSEIISGMMVGEKAKILGGGLFKLWNNTITIDRSSMSSKIGPIAISFTELKSIMQDVVGSSYKVELSM